MVHGGDLQLDRFARSDARLRRLHRDPEVALDLHVEPGLVAFVLPHPCGGQGEIGELTIVDRPGERVIAVVEGHDAVGQDAVGLPGQQRRAGSVAAVEVDARLLAHLEPDPVGQEAELGLVLLARDRDRPIGDDRRPEAIRAGDPHEVGAALRIVGAEGDRASPGGRVGGDRLARHLALGDAALDGDPLDQRGRQRRADRLALGVGRDDLERERLAVEVDVAGRAEADLEPPHGEPDRGDSETLSWGNRAASWNVCSSAKPSVENST